MTVCQLKNIQVNNPLNVIGMLTYLIQAGVVDFYCCVPLFPIIGYWLHPFQIRTQ